MLNSKNSSAFNSASNNGLTNHAALPSCSGQKSSFSLPISFKFSKSSSSTTLYSTTTSTTSYDSAGYGGDTGGSTDPLPTPTPIPVVRHFNQGIGNGAEGGDPGKSRPHGSSNDELGRTPGTPGNLFF